MCSAFAAAALTAPPRRARPLQPAHAGLQLSRSDAAAHRRVLSACAMLQELKALPQRNSVSARGHTGRR